MRRMNRPAIPNEVVAEVWRKYPGVMKRWEDNWDVISPMFKFSEGARKVLYTTNAIESLNSGFRRLNRSRSVFPNDMSLLKALYLASHELTKKWTMPVRNWGAVYAELAIISRQAVGQLIRADFIQGNRLLQYYDVCITICRQKEQCTPVEPMARRVTEKMAMRKLTKTGLKTF